MIVRVILAIAASYAAPLVAYAVRRVRRHTLAGVIVSVTGIAGVLAVMILPRDATLARALIGILASLNMTRAYSFWRDRIDVPIGTYLRFVSLGILRPQLIYSDPPGRRPHIATEIFRLMIALAVMIPAWILPGEIIPTPPIEDSFFLNQLIVLAAFIVLMGALGQALLAIWRLQGFPVRRPFSDNILLSRTPADFWRRWSWPIHGWLMRYVYHFNGGPRHHVRATLAVFFISGVGHELLFFAAVGRATGHQMLFFMLNAPAVLASGAMERFAQRHGRLGDAAIRAATIGFLVVASSLMFVSFHYVMPLYMKRICLMW